MAITHDELHTGSDIGGTVRELKGYPVLSSRLHLVVDHTGRGFVMEQVDRCLETVLLHEKVSALDEDDTGSETLGRLDRLLQRHHSLSKHLAHSTVELGNGKAHRVTGPHIIDIGLGDVYRLGSGLERSTILQWSNMNWLALLPLSTGDETREDCTNTRNLIDVLYQELERLVTEFLYNKSLIDDVSIYDNFELCKVFENGLPRHGVVYVEERSIVASRGPYPHQ